MAYNVRKNWTKSFHIVATKPVVLLPFLFIAFFEGLALEFIFYFPRKPLAALAGPIIRRTVGEAFMHYPGNLVILPELFQYAQVAIYVFFGVFLTGVCVGIVKNILMERPLQTGVLLKSALKRYSAFCIFGMIMVVLLFLLKKVDRFIYFKGFLGLVELFSTELGAGRIAQVLLKFSPFIFVLFIFLSNIVLQTFLILTVPIIVIREKSLFRALGGSIALGFRNFMSIFALLFWPLLIYLPIALLKADPVKLAEKTFPEINLWILAFGIILAVFVECFVVVCASQFLWEKGE